MLCAIDDLVQPHLVSQRIIDTCQAPDEGSRNGAPGRREDLRNQRPRLTAEPYRMVVEEDLGQRAIWHACRARRQRPYL